MGCLSVKGIAEATLVSMAVFPKKDKKSLRVRGIKSPLRNHKIKIFLFLSYSV
ncbi:hypothetical protein TCARB_1224 [Thermofilum adornatum 1505]|uniref:Uncharacterized protein n=1 Tax=Thermofilum adornatum 1505 TaxID=697581 RepID=A0A3G1A5Y6_9CREN|nr:hypothetical protein TCARB_1224 [Thermofilum adornatum 1505]